MALIDDVKFSNFGKNHIEGVVKFTVSNKAKHKRFFFYSRKESIDVLRKNILEKVGTTVGFYGNAHFGIGYLDSPYFLSSVWPRLVFICIFMIPFAGWMLLS